MATRLNKHYYYYYYYYYYITWASDSMILFMTLEQDGIDPVYSLRKDRSLYRNVYPRLSLRDISLDKGKTTACVSVYLHLVVMYCLLGCFYQL